MNQSDELALIISLIAIAINFLTILVNFGVFDWILDIFDGLIYGIQTLTEKITQKIKDTKN